MADTEQEIKTPAAPSSRQRLTDRYRKSRPDLSWDDENVDNDVDALAADELDAYDKDAAARSEMDEKMNGLFSSDPQAARIFLDWSNGQDPVEKLIEYYGDDFVNALQSPEGQNKFKEALEKWRTGRKADEEHQKAYDENIAKSAKTLVSFADKNGIDDETLKGIVDKAHQLGSDVCDGLYSEELLNLIYKGGNYDKAVDEAREEGRVNGKNENIRRELRQSKPTKTGLPPTVGGQGAVGTEAAPRKAKSGTISMFGGIPVKKNS